MGSEKKQKYRYEDLLPAHERIGKIVRVLLAVLAVLAVIGIVLIILLAGISSTTGKNLKAIQIYEPNARGEPSEKMIEASTLLAAYVVSCCWLTLTLRIP